jgi:hypothetical protein
VATPTDGDQKIMLLSEPNCPAHIGYAGAPRNESGTSINHAVPDRASFIVARVVRAYQFASKRFP